MSRFPTEQELLHGLTDPQREAVLQTEGPLLVLAGAGSGKTRVITRRIAYLISCGVPPWQILALTFTNKAAGEMRERVVRLLESGEEGVDPERAQRLLRGLTVTTFHSLCARLLRRYAEAAGLKPDFTIYDAGDQSSLCKKVIENLQLSTSNFPPRAMLSAISNAKNALLDAEDFAARAYDFTSRNVAKVYTGYTRALRGANAVDFDDLLLLTARLLARDAAVRHELQDRWQYLLIDEYQDTNKAQFDIASFIAGDPAKAAGKDGKEGGGGSGASPFGSSEQPRPKRIPNICVVGDPDQAIYGWRGADISNILDFEEHYPTCKVIKLGENFRSTAPILSLADTLIRHNKRRKHKDLFTKRPGGEGVSAILCRDERHEAQVVVDWLRGLHDAQADVEGEDAPRSENAGGGFAWKDMAVFYRTNALSRVMEEAFRGAGIPYTIARGTAFYDREEVKNAMAYLRVVANMADDVSLMRIVNVPARGIGDTSMDRIEAWAAARSCPVLEAMRHAEAVGDLSSRALNSTRKFVEMVDGWTGGGTFMGAELAGGLAELVARVIRESGLETMYRAQANASSSETDVERLENLDELVSDAREFEQEYDPANDPSNFDIAVAGAEPTTPPLLALLRAYLESVSLVADADAVDPGQGSVTLMTLHAAKGLEFPAVALVGLEEGVLPHARTLGLEDQVEEERRLAFVGITRAMRRLLLTCAKYRTNRGIPERTMVSRFLSELGTEHVTFSDQSDSLADLEETEWGKDSGSFESESQVPRSLREPKAAISPGARIANALPIGTLVRHPQFGLGKVLSVTTGANARAVIEFRDVGKKTLVLEYARLSRA